MHNNTDLSPPLEYRHIPGHAKDTDGAQSECYTCRRMNGYKLLTKL